VHVNGSQGAFAHTSPQPDHPYHFIHYTVSVFILAPLPKNGVLTCVPFPIDLVDQLDASIHPHLQQLVHYFQLTMVGSNNERGGTIAIGCRQRIAASLYEKIENPSLPRLRSAEDCSIHRLLSALACRQSGAHGLAAVLGSNPKSLRG